MLSTKRRMALAPFCLALLFMAACQDHHWVSYEKMGPLPEPKPVYTGVIAQGEVRLAPPLDNSSYSGWTLYVIARSTGQSMTLAVIKAVDVKFPFRFRVTGKDIMVGELKKDENFIVTARFDSDGDPATKKAGDLASAQHAPVPVGTGDIILALGPSSY